jgi:hypothetical protein
VSEKNMEVILDQVRAQVKEGLTEEVILWNFLTRRIQPL